MIQIVERDTRWKSAAVVQDVLERELSHDLAPIPEVDDILLEQFFGFHVSV